MGFRIVQSLLANEDARRGNARQAFSHWVLKTKTPGAVVPHQASSMRLLEEVGWPQPYFEVALLSWASNGL